MRAYGLYANSQRARWAVAREHFGQEPELLPLEFTWRDFCARMGHSDSAVCPVCGTPLVVYGRFRAGRGQPLRRNSLPRSPGSTAHGALAPRPERLTPWDTS